MIQCVKKVMLAPVDGPCGDGAGIFNYDHNGQWCACCTDSEDALTETTIVNYNNEQTGIYQVSEYLEVELYDATVSSNYFAAEVAPETVYGPTYAVGIKKSSHPASNGMDSDPATYFHT